MKRFVLIRHATAVETGPQGSDFHRRLKKRGRREAVIMAGRLASIVTAPDRLLSSPADRAVETAHIFAERYGVAAPDIALEEKLYGGLLADEFLRLVQALDDRYDCVLAFGHDPSFSEFAALMVPGFEEIIPKAGIVVMDFARRTWAAVRSGDGQLVAFERPPAPDVQKRLETELTDRLAGSLRTAMFLALRHYEIAESPEVVKTVARAATRVAKALRAKAVSAQLKADAPRPPGTRKKKGTRR